MKTLKLAAGFAWGFFVALRVAGVFWMEYVRIIDEDDEWPWDVHIGIKGEQ